MNIEGMYCLVAAKILDTATFERVWATNEEILALPEDNFCRMLGGALINFKDDGTGFMFCNTGKTTADVPADELKEALESKEVIEMDIATIILLSILVLILVYILCISKE